MIRPRCLRGSTEGEKRREAWQAKKVEHDAGVASYTHYTVDAPGLVVLPPHHAGHGKVYDHRTSRIFQSDAMGRSGFVCLPS